MQVKIKRFDKTLPLPSYKSDGAACADLCTRTDILVQPQQIAYIPLNVAIEIPSGHFALVVSRSSTHKLGIMQANSVGIIDSDYCGDNDELIYAAYNITGNPVLIEKGTRIAQLLILNYETIDLLEVDNLDNSDRGGFGSTGQK